MRDKGGPVRGGRIGPAKTDRSSYCVRKFRFCFRDGPKIDRAAVHSDSFLRFPFTHIECVRNDPGAGF